MSRGGDNDGADLLIGEEFDSGVGENAEEGGAVATEEATEAVLGIDVSHSGYNAEPGAGVFGEVGVGGLEEDFDAIEGPDKSLGLVKG